MMRLDQAEIVGLHGKAQRLAAQARNALAKADEAIDKGVEATVTVGAAFGFAVAQAKTGGIDMAGVPLDLAGGIALHALGFAGVGGKNSKYLHHAGTGALACFGVRQGHDVGTKWREKSGSGLFPTSNPAQIPAAASGNTMSESELETLARAGAPA